MRRRRDSDSVAARAMGGDRRSRLDEERSFIEERLDAVNDLTIEEFALRCGSGGIAVGYGTGWRFREDVCALLPSVAEGQDIDPTSIRVRSDPLREREGLTFNLKLMLIQDSDVPAIWYRRLKKAWAAPVETGAPFANPVQPFRWRG